jgi:hypothetical protein
MEALLQTRRKFAGARRRFADRYSTGPAPACISALNLLSGILVVRPKSALLAASFKLV